MFDLVVVGGGINGVGIAADAAGRGLRVLLCEQGDLAGGTSSASTKLIHGGLRYLENYEFLVVRKALIERDILYHKACHLIRPMRFVLPVSAGMRSQWIMRFGLLLYDHLYWGNSLPSSRGVNLAVDPYGKPLLQRQVPGFVYSDCWTDDARLVILNALAAKASGAEILTRTRFTRAKVQRNTWQVQLVKADGTELKVEARSLVNATGPWLDDVLTSSLQLADKPKLQLVKGSHIVLPRLYEGEHAYLVQASDQRVVFIIPFEQDFSLVGTTERQYGGLASDVKISADETEYLLAVVKQYFAKNVTSHDICYGFSGCRPLAIDDAENLSAKSRDYQLQLRLEQQAPLLNIIGGKLTTYRVLAQQAVDKLKPYLPTCQKSLTASSLLPGAVAVADYAEFQQQFCQQYAWLPAPLLQRYLRSYGSLAEKFLSNKTCLAALGHEFGHGLYQAEVDYLVEQEWAQEAMDILWRRSKLKLRFDQQQLLSLQQYLSQQY